MTNYDLVGDEEEQVTTGEVETGNSEETTPSETQDFANQDVPETNVFETAKNGENHGVDKNSLTHEQKMQYSFRRQLGKQKAKYEGQYTQLQTQYNELLERLDRLEHPEKFQPLNRNQFQDDDSYIDALVQQRFDNMWNQKLMEAQQKYSEQARQDQEVQAYKTRQDDNVKKLFKTPEAEQQYRQAIGTALQNGLGELIDEDKEVAQYIMRSDLGPKILYEFATKPEEVEKMFNDNVTPMDRQFMIRDLENRLRNEINKPSVPVIGKPGISTEAKPGSIFDSDDSILNYLRTH